MTDGETPQKIPRQCPRCKRPVRPKNERRNPYEEPETIAAVLRDGTCPSCWIITTKGKDPAEFYAEKRPQRRRKEKRVFTDEDARDLREKIQRMEMDRLCRGVPVDGIPPEDWGRGNGGLYASEIP